VVRITANVSEPAAGEGHKAKSRGNIFRRFGSATCSTTVADMSRVVYLPQANRSSPKPRFPIDAAIFADHGSVFCAEFP
jgi:hypothetical protein